MEITPISAAGGVELRGIDIAAPVSDKDAGKLVELFNRHGLLLFRDQAMDKQKLVEATRIFGFADLHPLGNIHDGDAPEVTVISTHGRDGDVIPDDEEEMVGKIDWHTDQAYVPAPNRGGLMYSVEIPPEDGRTGFIDMCRTYDALSDETKAQIEGMTVVQSWKFAQESIARDPSFRTDEGARMLELDRFPDLLFPLVRDHPITGRKSLYVPRMWSSRLIDAKGDDRPDLLAQLIDHSQQPQFIYWHSYAPGDVVAWDNWRMIHAASGTKGRYRRIMHRTVIRGGVPMGVPLNASDRSAAA